MPQVIGTYAVRQNFTGEAIDAKAATIIKNNYVSASYTIFSKVF